MEKSIKCYGYFWNALLLGTSIVALLYFITINLDHRLKFKYPKTAKIKIA